MFEELVDEPRDGGGGHLVDDARGQSSEEALLAAARVDGPHGLTQTLYPPGGLLPTGDGRPRLQHAHLLLRVQQSFTHVQRRRGGRRHSASHGAGRAVRHGVVLPAGVEQVLARFVHDEVDALERDVHGELRKE